MQWWSWAGRNSDSCVPSETRPKGGKQEAVGKGREWDTGLRRDTYKILNFPTLWEERREALPFTPHPCRLPQPPVHVTRHPFGRQGKAGGTGGIWSSPEASAPSPFLPSDPPHLGAGTSPARDEHPPCRPRRRAHTHTNARTQATQTKIHADFSWRQGNGMSSGGELCQLPSEPPFQLTSPRIEPLDTRTQPNAALTYLHAARKSSHC